MPQYCDSKALERNWFHWLVASSTPALEPYRLRGLLYTKILGTVTVETKSGTTRDFPNPVHPARSHRIVTDPCVYFNSYSKKGVVSLAPPCVSRQNRPIPTTLPTAISAVSDPMTIAHAIDNGYICELPTQQTWDAIANDLQNMCRGISYRFNMSSDDKDDLAQDTFIAVLTKIRDKKIIYTPGRAPVFSLLTTTIYRVIFGFLNKGKRYRQNMTDVIDEIKGQTKRSRQHRRNTTKHVGGSLVSC